LNAKVVAVRGYVAEDAQPTRWVACIPNKDCGSFAKFYGAPRIAKYSEQTQRIEWNVKNWSEDRWRRARMSVEYEDETRRAEIRRVVGPGAFSSVPNPACGSHGVRCEELYIGVLASAHVVSVLSLAKEHGTTQLKPCLQNQDCEIGWSRFEAPTEEVLDGWRILGQTFKNWSADRARNPALVVEVQ
jgi:hypothetical protein